MIKRLLVTGAHGFLGSRICEYFNEKRGYETVGVSHRELDIEDELAVSAFIKAIHPDYVIHCAGISDVGVCEREPAQSERINVRGTANLARSCRKEESRLIFISSDQVYSGVQSLEPNREGGEGKPTTVYGKDKKRAEEIMLSYLPDAVALRLSWQYDVPGAGRVPGKGVLERLAQAKRENEKVEFPIHDYRSFTYVWETVRRLEDALELPGGVYNFASENSRSAYDTAKLFLKELTGNESCDILSENEKRFASCPRNLTMSMDKIKSYGIHFLETTEGFRQCCREHEGEVIL